MSLSCGIVGLPNVGKSTLFNALTNASIAAENFPFCTVDPNVGMVSVNDARLEAISNLVNPLKTIPTSIEFYDIAGLVEGAAKGEGLGNKFLSHIRNVDCIVHVVRCFEEDNIVHVNNKVDPLKDIEIINYELIFADLESIEKSLIKLQKLIKANDKEAKSVNEVLLQIKEHLTQGKLIDSMDLDEAQKKLISSYNFLTIKPTIFVANVSEQGFENNPHFENLKNYTQSQNIRCIPISNAFEAEIASFSKEEKMELLKDIGQKQTGLDRLVLECFSLLNLISFFTAGEKEVRAWDIIKGSNAQNASARIHTDFAKHFIRAEVIDYEDYIQNKGEKANKELGKMRLEGKEYVVKDGDVIYFRIGK